MVRGIGNVEYIRQGSEVTVADQPNWSFLYLPSTVKDPRYNVGDRVVTPDGRVFRYSKAATGGVKSMVGASILKALKVTTVAVLPAQSVINGPVINQFGANATTTAGAVGSNVITVTIASGDGVAANGAIAADELRGGYIVYNHGSTQYPQNRGIIGNSAVASGGGTCNVYLDAAISPVVIGSTTYSAVVVGTTTAEVFLNPYNNMVAGDVAGDGFQTFLGVPATLATVGQYFWLQTWGPCWITSDSLTADDVNDRTVYFQNNGSIKARTEATGDLYQPAGVVMDNSSTGASNSPFVMLQISI
jgi:hypothetical protein